IADRLRERGYLYFTSDLVLYDADTTVGDRQVDLVLRLERPHAKPHGLAGTPEGTVYRLGEVTIATVSPFRSQREMPRDTLLADAYRIVYPEPLRYTPDALTGMVFISPGDHYRQSNVDRTYRRLTGLQVFDRVEMRFDTVNAAPGIAHARIDLVPAKEQSFSTEGFATNRGGLLGTSLSVGYRHRNMFRGMGSMQLRMVLGLEAQQSFTGQGTSTAEEAIGNVTTEGFFNTMDIGPELTLRFPHFLLPRRRDRFARSSIPSSVVSILYNHQRRPDFTRNLGKVSFGYDWQESRTKSWSVHPLEVNVIRIPERSAEFAAYLEAANDPVLTDSYTDHLIAGMHGQFVHNTQGMARRRNTFFSRITLDWAGHPMLVPLSMLATETVDTLGNSHLTVAGIRYAEFIKLDSDLRWRHTVDPKTSVAFRVAAGAGLPYGNLGVLPFESSFFVGGANGLRAWRARSLGPGGYSAPLVAFDRIGEVRIEGNAEYRFKLIGFLEGAFFVDVGNIWNLQEDPRKPGSGFSHRFLSELAVGTGFGARFNFDFFIVRFDLGMQTKDPSLPPGERWLFQGKDRYEAMMGEALGRPVQYRTRFNLNLGIGYPF
ncbi:MAG: BamA/TamA family outer membrane protein, partial [Flavobacteriales bacterium]|nr:BamA/TamA family outer membrane protein [Flavobacteriales bacterium]